MARLFAGAVEVEGPSGTRVSVEKARNIVRVAATDVILLIHGARLQWVGRHGDGGLYGHLLVDVDEVRAVLQPPRASEGLTLNEVMPMLPGVKHHSLPRLAAAGLLAYETEYRPESLRTLKVFKKSRVEAFAAEYAALNEVAVAMGLPALHAMRVLSRAGIAEALDFQKVRSKIYRRSEVASFLARADVGVGPS
jgi:hypothetical protein